MARKIRSFAGFAFAALVLTGAVPTFAQKQTDLSEYRGATPPSFADPSAALGELKNVLAAKDVEGLAKLLGLNAEKLRQNSDAMLSLALIREGASRQLRLQDVQQFKVVAVGDILWPLPFPLSKQEDGKWAFDTEVGLEEIVNRRIGENELVAIQTMRDYVEAQYDYALIDEDNDLIFEFAQRLISTPGKRDGLYWEPRDDEEESPAGPMLEKAAFNKAKRGEGYYGYRFRILTGQGPNVLGGEYSYIVNGNMTNGFALIAWPVTYAVTGVQTFIINQWGIVYEADLGEKTEERASAIQTFNPNGSWEITMD